eukprot:TRINITY_DN36821_c0_g1_i1.p1 TRINITY_DN36821_c0_g1~~TRINITY_DN36821_c0_g1_i1.p1  ORF type:complete len:1384 (-),score=197.57 TRINITY_DN36821_c0_g1_i1:182-4333(-)
MLEAGDARASASGSMPSLPGAPSPLRPATNRSDRDHMPGVVDHDDTSPNRCGSALPRADVALDVDSPRHRRRRQVDGDVSEEDDSDNERNGGDSGAGEIPPPLPPPVAPPNDEVIVRAEDQQNEEAPPADARSGVLALVSNVSNRIQSLPSLPEPPAVPMLPTVDPLSWVQDAPEKYCELQGRFPALFFVGYLIVFLVVGLSLSRPVVVDTDLNSFFEVQSVTSAEHTVYRDALRNIRAVKNSTALDDRVSYELEIIYQAKTIVETEVGGDVVGERDGSIFSEAALRDIRKFEQELRGMEGWKRLCAMSDTRAQFRCEPGESLGNYVWPHRLEDDLESSGYFKLGFQGRAREQFPTDAALAFLTRDAAKPHDPWKFLPESFNSNQPSAKLLRSVFAFTAPELDDFGFKEAFADFVRTSLYQMLKDAVVKAQTVPDPKTWDEPSHVFIYFRGRGVDDYEVRLIIGRDMRLAIGASVICWVSLWVQLRSVFLATGGFTILCLVVILSYAILHLQKVSLVTFLGVFLIIGLGSNVLIVVNDVFRRSRRAMPGKDEITERIMTCYRVFFWWLMPIAFTAVTFFAQLASDVRPLREFGLFTGTSMLLACFLCLVMYVPLLLVHELTVRPFCVRRLHRHVARIFEPRKLQLPWKKIATLFIRAARKTQRVLLVTALVTLICTIAAIATAATRGRSGLPEVFPATHHRSAGRPLAAVFSPTGRVNLRAPETTTVCQPGPKPDGVDQCGLHWCEAPLAEGNMTRDALSECPCFRNKTAVATHCDVLNVMGYVSGAGVNLVSDEEHVRAFGEFILSEWPNVAKVFPSSASASRVLPSLVLENWRTGLTDIQQFVQMPTLRVELSPRDLTGATSNSTFEQEPSVCTDFAICYCGHRACEAPRNFAATTNTLTLNSTSARVRRLLSDLEIERRLQQSSTPLEGRRLATFASVGTVASSFQDTTTTEVVVMYGIMPLEPSWTVGQEVPKWSYDPKFDPASPWAQRAMASMSLGKQREGLKASLNVIEVNSWIVEFRKWLLGRGEKFPVERFGNFHEQLDRFVANYQAASPHIWLDERSQMRACSLHFRVKLSESSSKILETQTAWRNHIREINEYAHSTANNAWSTSKSWVEAEAFQKSLASAWSVAGLGVLAIVLAGLAYTLDMRVVFCVTLVSIIACTVIAFVMFCCLSWSVGPWEVVVLTVFLTYSVEPAFRLCRDFVVPDSGFGATGLINDDAALATDDEEAADSVEQPLPGEMHDVAAGDSMVAYVPNDQNDGEAEQQQIDGVSSIGTPPEQGTSESAREARIQRSVYLVSENTLSGGTKLMLSGILLCPCEFQLFSRLGAVSIVLPLVSVPCTLIILPAIMLRFYPESKERDCVMCWKWIVSKVSWAWS